MKIKKIVIVTGAVIIATVSAVTLKNKDKENILIEDEVSYSSSDLENHESESENDKESDVFSEESFVENAEENSNEEESSESTVTYEDYLNELEKIYEEYKLPDEVIDEVYETFKSDFVNAPSDFVDSANALYDYVLNKYYEDKLINFTNIDEESSAYDICKLMDSYVNKDSYTDADLYVIIGMVNQGIYTNMFDEYSENDKFYLYKSIDNLIAVLEENVLIEGFSTITAEYTNEEYIILVREITEEKINNSQISRTR